MCQSASSKKPDGKESLIKVWEGCRNARWLGSLLTNPQLEGDIHGRGEDQNLLGGPDEISRDLESFLQP